MIIKLNSNKAKTTTIFVDKPGCVHCSPRKGAESTGWTIGVVRMVTYLLGQTSRLLEWNERVAMITWRVWWWWAHGNKRGVEVVTANDAHHHHHQASSFRGNSYAMAKQYVPCGWLHRNRVAIPFRMANRKRGDPPCPEPPVPAASVTQSSRVFHHSRWQLKGKISCAAQSISFA